MSRLRRKFSLEEKLQIIHEAEQQGIELTLHKHLLSDSLYYKWKNSFDRKDTDLFAKVATCCLIIAGAGNFKY